jgi:hypothetical protein
MSNLVMKTKCVMICIGIVATYGCASRGPIFTSIENGDEAAVRSYLIAGGDPNAEAVTGGFVSFRTTLLMCAVRWQEPEMCRLLLLGGADWHTRDSKGFTAVHEAKLHLMFTTPEYYSEQIARYQRTLRQPLSDDTKAVYRKRMQAAQTKYDVLLTNTVVRARAQEVCDVVLEASGGRQTLQD